MPRADFELILPGQFTVTRPFFICKLLIALCTSLRALYEALTSDAAYNYTFLVGFVTYTMNLFFQYSTQMATYNALMTKFMYDKTVTSGDGTRYSHSSLPDAGTLPS